MSKRTVKKAKKARRRSIVGKPMGTVSEVLQQVKRDREATVEIAGLTPEAKAILKATKAISKAMEESGLPQVIERLTLGEAQGDNSSARTNSDIAKAAAVAAIEAEHETRISEVMKTLGLSPLNKKKRAMVSAMLTNAQRKGELAGRQAVHADAARKEQAIEWTNRVNILCDFVAAVEYQSGTMDPSNRHAPMIVEPNTVRTIVSFLRESGYTGGGFSNTANAGDKNR